MSRVPLHLVDDAPPNPCGGCTACCTVLRVVELGKGFHSPCPYIVPSGCRIYADRPGSCRTWSCLWARGMVSDDPRYRPDRLGLILDITVRPGVAFLTAYEVWSGASRQPAAQEFLDRIEPRYKQCVVSVERTVFSTDAPLAEELNRIASPASFLEGMDEEAI